MEYKIVVCYEGWTFARKVEKITAAVNELIQHGWEPVGGIAITDHSLSQAMIKRR